MFDIFSYLGINLSREQVQAMKIPNGPQSLACYAWMSDYFQMMGDSMPNMDEVHLEPIDIKEIYEEYLDDAKSTGFEALNTTNFTKIWRNLFPHVKIREFKAVTGKCSTCAKLSDARKLYKDREQRVYLTEMHFLHRSAYMNERMKYAERRQLAYKLPNSFLSIIIDGMAQNHCKLPWYNNLKDTDNALPQHLQGVLNHGRSFTIFRTFHNVRSGANLAIHSFLCELEETINREGRLPDTIFLQIDGGSENTAKAVLGICELLVAKRLTKKLVISRLIVGHTHEDIDAVFARIWLAVRNQLVLSPQAYEEILMKALRERKNVKIVDLFVVPDYLKYLQPFIDPEFANYSKGKNTQLQFIFEAVVPEDHFPHGVKTTYRAYASDNVVKILENESSPCCFEAINEVTSIFPESYVRSDGTIQPEGMYILKCLPDENSVIQPMGFIDNSRELLVNIANKIHKELFKYNAKRAQDWIDFVENIAPQTNSATTYLNENPMHVPLRQILFSNATIDSTSILPVKSSNSLPSIKTIPTVRWSGANQNFSATGAPKIRRIRKIGEPQSFSNSRSSNSEEVLSNDNTNDEINHSNSRSTNLEEIILNDNINEENNHIQIEELGMDHQKNDLNTAKNKPPTKKNRKRKRMSIFAPASSSSHAPVPDNARDVLEAEHEGEESEEDITSANIHKRKIRSATSKEYSLGELFAKLT